LKYLFHFFLAVIIITVTGVSAKAGNAQERVLDSLKTLSKTVSESDRKLDVNLKIAEAFFYVEPDSGFTLVNQIIAEAQKNHNEPLLASAYNLLAFGYLNTGRGSEATLYLEKSKEIASRFELKSILSEIYLNEATIFKNLAKYDSTVIKVKQALQLVNANDFPMIYAKAYNLLGLVNVNRGYYKNAILEYKKSIEFADKVKDLRLKSSTLSNLGFVSEKMGNLSQALHYYNTALELKSLIGDKKGMATAYGGLGLFYNSIKDYRKSLNYHFVSLKIREELKDNRTYSLTLNNIGNAYLGLNMLDSAEYFFTRSSESYKKTGDKKGYSMCLNNLGELYFIKKNFPASENYLKQALDLKQKIGDITGMEKVYTNLSKLKEQSGNLNDAIALRQKALSLSIKAEMLPMEMENSKNLAELYSKTKDYKSAYAYSTRYAALKDSIQNAENEFRLNHLEEFYKSLQQVENSEKLAAINKRDKKIIGQQQIIVLVFIIALILCAVLLVYVLQSNVKRKRTNETLRRQKKEIEKYNSHLLDLNNEIRNKKEKLQEQKENLEQLLSVKDKLISVISHDLRGPMATLKSTLNMIREGYLTPEDISELTSGINESIDNTLELLENLLNWAGSQMNRIRIHPEYFAFDQLADEVIALVTAQAKIKGVKIEKDISPEILAFADVHMIRIVLRNLVTNAIKYTGQGGKITIYAQASPKEMYGFIRDTGIGISGENLKRLMSSDLYSTTGTANEKGTGLGLLLCQEFLDKNGGKLKIESEPGRGSIFSFTLPVSEPLRGTPVQKRVS